MRDIKPVVAKNLTSLRQARGMTQLELAEQLNYSDKTVSKWERGESLPDVAVLAEIAAIFDVTLDYFVKETHQSPPKPRSRVRYWVLVLITVAAVWVLALSAFAVLRMSAPDSPFHWLAFLYTVPVSLILWLIFNSLWFTPRLNYVIISLLMWSALLCIHLSLLPFGIHIENFYLLGIPGQIIIVLTAYLCRPKPIKTEETD
ncbi:MAG: helix-turn-helix transcriptional regulator [Clostridia bacterium]|nr:helix-turn-helix transcriptional regulator [Clostridia bacterium]